jgi:hypothetical protein
MIRHQNVVDVYDVAEEEGLVTRQRSGSRGQLARDHRAGKRCPIPPEMAVRIIADAASGCTRPTSSKTATAI